MTYFGKSQIMESRVKTDAKGMFYMKRNDKEFVNSITGSNIQKGCRRIAAWILLVGLIFGVTGCGHLSDTGISYIYADTDVSTLSEATIDKIVENIVNSMSLNDKVGQMFVVDLTALEPSRKSVQSKQLTSKMKRNLKLYPVGGVVLFSNDIKSRKQVQRLLTNLQQESRIELFVCVDEEGGSVSRIASNSKMKTTRFPSMLEIGKTEDTQKAFEVGDTIGREIRELGFSVDFAPVADVLAEGDEECSAKTELENRSFGYDAQSVATMVKQTVKGLEGQQVCATLKHFPGQGAASSDTHVSAANISKTISELRSTDFLPFQSGIEGGASFVMLSQASLQSLTGDSTPACMSSLVVRDILREELGFSGIVITDAMNMHSITSRYTSAEAAVNCVSAGVDMILMPEDLEEAYNGILDGVKEGTISKARIDKAVSRIIKCKIKKGILPLTSDVVVKASQSSYENYHNIGELQNGGK